MDNAPGQQGQQSHPRAYKRVQMRGWMLGIGGDCRRMMGWEEENVRDYKGKIDEWEERLSLVDTQVGEMGVSDELSMTLFFDSILFFSLPVYYSVRTRRFVDASWWWWWWWWCSGCSWAGGWSNIKKYKYYNSGWSTWSSSLPETSSTIHRYYLVAAVSFFFYFPVLICEHLHPFFRSYFAFVLLFSPSSWISWNSSPSLC